jgi:Holliday junction DNA helicase RuvA
VIASVRGTVQRVGISDVVIEVGGVGLIVLCPPQTALALRQGQDTTLQTSLVVREESLSLYGFEDDEQRGIFEAVQTVSGIGPRIALAMLATLTPDQIRRAIAHEDIAALTKVSGIGRKGAERLTLELRDRLAAPSPASPASPGGATGGWESMVRDGLESLGWSRREAEAAVVAIAPEAGDEPDVAGLLRAALRSLDRR